MVMPLVVRPCIRCCNEAKCRDCDDGSAERFEDHELFLRGLVGEQGWGADPILGEGGRAYASGGQNPRRHLTIYIAEIGD